MTPWTLIRLNNHPVYGCFGALLDPDRLPFCVTLEDPYNFETAEQEGSQSAIRTGRYVCKAILSPKFGNTFQVMDVPGRTAILIHAGNTSNNAAGGKLDDTRGCVLLANSFGDVDGQPGVIGSKDALNKFLTRLDREGATEFPLKIAWV